MKRHEYIKRHADILKRQCDQRERLCARSNSGILSHKAAQKISAELNFLGMEITKSEERLRFALGDLNPENAISEFRPSPFHRYEGLKWELERTKFD